MSSMSLRGIPTADLLYVITDGDFTLDEATRDFGIMLDMVVANDSRKVLLDGRRIVGEPTAVQRYYYAAFASDSVGLLIANQWMFDPPRFAYVLNEPVLDSLRLGQTVARKRGLDVKAFDDIDEAIRWLKVSPEVVRIINEEPQPSKRARRQSK